VILDSQVRSFGSGSQTCTILIVKYIPTTRSVGIFISALGAFTGRR